MDLSLICIARLGHQITQAASDIDLRDLADRNTARMVIYEIGAAAMAPTLVKLSGAGIEDSLEKAFLKAAETNREEPSDALRKLLKEYVANARAEETRRQSRIIRQDSAEEMEALDWISSYGVIPRA